MDAFKQTYLEQIPSASEAFSTNGDSSIATSNLQSGNYSPNTSSGWRLETNGDAYVNRLSVAGSATVTGSLVISGTITVTGGGVVGGFDIGTDYLRDTGNSFGLASTVTGSADVRFWAGDTFANRATAPLRFYEDGTGVLGAWNITTTALRSGATDAASNILLDPTNSLLRLGPTSGSYLSLDGANQRIRSSNYVVGVSGFTIEPTLVEAENIIARGTMRGTVFAYDRISAIGGQLMIANADTLASDMTAFDASTLTVKGDSTFAVNDILVMRGVATSGIQEEWLRVTAIGSAPTYTVTRDLASSFSANSNPVWKAGTPVVKQGVSDGASSYSGGWLRLIGEGTNAPYYSVFSRTGVAYNSYSETIRLGNLNGFLDYASNLYGIGIGETNKYLKYDTTNGLRIAGDITNTTFITAGEDLTVNDWVGIWADGKVYKATAGNANSAEQLLGVVLVTTSSAGSAPVQMSDKTTAVSGLTIGSVYYLQNPTDVLTISSTGDTNAALDGTQWYAQTFTTVGSTIISGVKLRLKNGNNPASDITVSIRATSAGLPTGSDLISGTITKEWVSTSYSDVYVQFSSLYTLSAATKYAIVVRTASSNGFSWQYYSGVSQHAGGAMCISNNSGSTWSEDGTGKDLYCSLVKANGTIGTTPGFSIKKVGIAVSATKLLILQSTASGTYSGAGGSGTGDMVLASDQTVTGAKTFGTIGGTVGKFILAGSTSGSTILNAASVAGSTTITLPGSSTTLVGTDTTQTLTAKTLTAPIISTISNTGTLTLPTSTDTLVGKATTDTLTNKRVTPRITSISSSGTPTINTDDCDAVTITAQATAITSMTTNLSGTPTNFQKLLFRIKDNGTARAITWGASFEAKGVTLPTTTVVSKVLTVGFIYDTVTSKWGCVASAQEA